MKLIASLAPARAELEAGVVAKADQYMLINQVNMKIIFTNCTFAKTNNLSFKTGENLKATWQL